MPLQSREVVTLRLILDCDDTDVDDASDDDIDTEGSRSKTPAAGLLSLPAELRLKILRYVLRFDFNREQHTRRVPEGSIDRMLHLDSRRILEAPQFRHKKSKQEINGSLPIYHTTKVYPALLRTCRLLHEEGVSVLYRENKVIAIHAGIRGLGSKFRNLGIPLFGPFPTTRAVSPIHLSQMTDPKLRKFSTRPGFVPVMIFQGKNSTLAHPFYVCSVMDAYDFIQGLWIMIKSPFAKGMSFIIHLTNETHFRAAGYSDLLMMKYVLPWMHNHIEGVLVHSEEPPSDEDIKRSDAIQQIFDDHIRASVKAPNVYTYTKICELLEHILQHAETHVAQAQYLEAELKYERVCYEACNMVRTRTGKLVDVSTKVKEGINRVCKLIAISAFRLCELRSGAVVSFRGLRQAKSVKLETPTSPEDSIPAPLKPLKKLGRTGGLINESKVEEGDFVAPQTTRLAEDQAIEHALLSGLLAMRLPCATPVPEWNIRLNTILLDLFRRQRNWKDALTCARRLHHFFSILVKEARTKNKKARQEVLEAVIKDLAAYVKAQPATVKPRDKQLQELVAHSHDVARRLWGERLTPRKGYTGLIWTFRWA